MDSALDLPEALLIEIGRFASDWAIIEQEIMLWTRPLAASEAGNEPVENLRMDLKRLRKRWFELVKKASDKAHHSGLLNLNNRLANAARARGYALHGIWYHLEVDKLLVYWWEQRDSLQGFELPTTLDEFRDQTRRLRVLRLDVRNFPR